ncbi:PAS domain S-box protein [Paracoccus liaowanqingii]|uniref:PAS domain S-box protein n=1 Tax=Paracoccus liaowanqingii TaxID=2560053 RepID=A0A4P7HP96_9RHOB|nr:sigma 54-interacting transcriptional regulator [Paracoccus liaowanqingii]QBX35081.1 PAS domain S-box protein [Paracoccus liaowanqingii]
MDDDIDSLLGHLPLAALILDTQQDRIAWANRAAAQLLTLSRPSGARFSTLLGRALPKFIVFADEVAHRGQAWARDIPLSDARDQPLTVELRATPLPGRPGHLLLTLLDLRELDLRAEAAEAAQTFRSGLMEWKHAQAFFADLERQNQLILNAAGEGIYGVNAEGKTTFLNRAAQEMLGWTAADLLGRDIHSVIHHHHLNGDHYPAHDCPIYRSFRFEQIHRIEDEVFWRKDGRPIRVEYVSTPIYDHKVLAGAVVIFRDITERYENERRLREALDQVDALRDRLEQENAYLQEAITSERAHHDIIGGSGATRQVLTRIALVAPTDAPVMITGEAGTGKALVATAIHKDSPRQRRPLIAFKCSAHAPDMIEAELFGQMRSHQLGTQRDRPGKLELAHGGTLFLDDLAEMPLELQGRLLHALQTAQVTRLGDLRARPLDIRAIAALTRPPEVEIDAGRLRDDLALFLNVFPIQCRPLRDRPEDIPPLTDHLLGLACKRMNRPCPLVSTRTMQRLLAYDWPGNVRELGNVIERAVILSTGHDKLVLDMGEEAAPLPATGRAVLTEAEVQAMARANILNALRETRGKVAGAGGAAILLGIPATTLYSRMAKLAIREAEWTVPGG